MNDLLKTQAAPGKLASVAAALKRARESEFAQKVAETFATRIAVLVLSVATSIVITRLLGPEGRGVFAIASTLSAVGVQFGDLGLSAANTYFVAKERPLLPALTGNALFVSLVMGTLAVLLLAGLAFAWPALLPSQGMVLLLALLAIPFGLALNFTQNLLMGIQDTRGANKVSLWSAILLLALTAGLGMGRKLTPETALAVALLAVGAGFGWMLRRLQSHAAAIRFSLPLLRRSAAYGLKFYVGNFFAFLLLRSDMLMVGGRLGKETAGFYAVAVTLANLIFMLPNVIGAILFPRLSATADWELKWRTTRQALIGTVAIVVISSVVGGLLARPFVTLMYGAKFEAAVPAFLWLLPGMLFWSASSVLSAYIASEQIPMRVVVIFFAAFGLNLALNCAFLTRYGIVAASVDSSVSYGLAFAAIWVFVALPMRRRHEGILE